MSSSSRSGSVQTGVSLIIVMILLLIMTLLGLAVLRGTLMEERMAGNLYDRGLTFQAVEGALREAEARITAGVTVPTSLCSAGVCATPISTNADRWNDTASANWTNAKTFTAGSVTTTPKYIIEYMGEVPTWNGCDRIVPIPALCMAPSYRITAISVAPGRAQVLLQTNFIKQ